MNKLDNFSAMNNNPYKVASLFAGIGGVCTAFHKSGCDIAWANELDAKACETYRYNKDTNGCKKLVEQDITTIENPESLGKVDILTSGFPCQAFSIAGYREGFNDRHGRGNLFMETARFIADLKPKAYLLENVRNLIAHDNGNTFNVIREKLVNDLGYSFIPFVLNSKDYGNIPQTRERIYIVGFRGESECIYGVNEQPYENLFVKKSKKTSASLNFKIPGKLTLNKSIHDLIDSSKHDDIFYYPEGHRYYKQLSNDITKRDTIYQWRRVYVRENKSNVCPTLTANMGTGGHNVPLILDNYGIRKLTPKECLNFQGFPKKYNFPEGMARSHCYKQAGNSVVIPVVKRIAKAITKSLDTKKFQQKQRKVA